MKKIEPLSFRMRPRNLDEFIGQEHIISKGKLLYRMIQSDTISSIILYGPPGTGKTSLAQVIANSTKTNFERINAVTSGVAEIKKIVTYTKNPILNQLGRTALFIDEIHRFNKAQQDALLPYVENGEIILIGATTQSPFFEVNKSLISRSTIFMLKPLTDKNIKEILKIALKDKERGLGQFDIHIEEKSLDYISNVSNGDSRIALNTLEIALKTSKLNSQGAIKITFEDVKECMQQKIVTYDNDQDEHYDNISAFIKSMRGSDPDAAVFYLARAIYAGEDPLFLARRIIICASEDVGLANPSALNQAVAAFEAVNAIGMPEARIILSQAAIMVATSPKSNSSHKAINSAIEDIKNKKTGCVPMHLRNSYNKKMTELGYGDGYKYPNNFKGNNGALGYLPEEMIGTKYYCPSSNGYEFKIKDWMSKKDKG